MKVVLSSLLYLVLIISLLNLRNVNPGLSYLFIKFDDVYAWVNHEVLMHFILSNLFDILEHIFTISYPGY